MNNRSERKDFFFFQKRFLSNFHGILNTKTKTRLFINFNYHFLLLQ